MFNKIFTKKNLIMIALVLLMTFNFYTNFLSKANIGNHNFETFQCDSEDLVLGKLYYDSVNDIDGKCEYGLCLYKNFETKNIFNMEDKSNLNFESYKSQFGLQGYTFSFLYNKIHIPINGIKMLLCLLLSITLCSISYFISKKYDKLMGIVFYMTFFLSPWVIFFARNLYWVEFTWFIPCLLGLLLSINYDKKKIIIPLIFISIFVKCLCGYEYITTIMFSTITFFIIDFFKENSKDKKIKIFKTIIIIGITCLLGFILAISIHGLMRGEGNLVKGVKDIYQNDVLRRTILTLDKDSYDGIARESMDASVSIVLNKYIYEWHTEIIYGINGNLFPLICFGSFAVCIIGLLQKEKDSKDNIIMLIAFFVTTTSWYILGKSHSYIHIHMNYVLWYFGYIQICLYIFLKFIISEIKKLIND